MGRAAGGADRQRGRGADLLGAAQDLRLALPSAEVPDYEKDAGQALAETIRTAVGTGHPVEIRPLVVRGHAAAALLDAADGATLLVVGNRGHGGFAEALLGSVSQQCVQHASCPVVVVRGPGS